MSPPYVPSNIFSVYLIPNRSISQMKKTPVQILPKTTSNFYIVGLHTDNQCPAFIPLYIIV